MEELVEILASYYTNYFWTVTIEDAKEKTTSGYHDALSRYVSSLKQPLGFNTSLGDIAAFYTKHKKQMISAVDIKNIIHDALTSGSQPSDQDRLASAYITNVLVAVMATIVQSGMAADVLNMTPGRADAWKKMIKDQLSICRTTFVIAYTQNNPSLLKANKTPEILSRYKELLDKHKQLGESYIKLRDECIGITSKYKELLIQAKALVEENIRLRASVEASSKQVSVIATGVTNTAVSEPPSSSSQQQQYTIGELDDDDLLE
jgi:hypothetical protein